MRKEELRKLRALPATKEMMQKGKNFEERTEIRYYDKKKITKHIPEYDVLMRIQNLQSFIKVAVFFPERMRKNIKTPTYEIFINVKGNEWITRVLDEEGKEVRWSSSMIDNLEGVTLYGYYSNSKPKIFINADGMRTLNGLRLEDNQDKKGALRIMHWQREQRSEEIQRSEQKEQAPWDEDMKLIPEIAKDFDEWMRKDVCPDTYIIYEFKKGGATEGYCSRCKKMVSIKNPRHGGKTKCPACKAEANFKSSGKIQTLSTSEYEGEIIQKIKNGIVIRAFRQHQWYRGGDYKVPRRNLREYERVLIFENGMIRRYTWDNYKNKFNRWCIDKSYTPSKRTYYWSKRIKLYKKNLVQLKKTSILKQSSIDLWETLPTSVTNYLQIEKGNPAVEMSAKIGMFELAKGLIEANYDNKLLEQEETELSKLLKIDKARLKRLKDMDGGVYALKWMQFEKLHDTIWPDEMIRDFGDGQFTTADLNFLKIPVSLAKCYSYLKKQSALMDETLHQTMVTWRDYINMADQMKMNTTVEQIAQPKDLRVAHDKLIYISKSKGLDKQAKELEKKWPKVNKQLPKLKKFEFEFGEYCIVVPNKVLDIVTEGVILGHCVHTCDYYFSRIQIDESYLFFLRKKKNPDMPWYTLEVEPSGNIRQKRTTGDKQNIDFEKAMLFLKKWQQYFKKQLTKAEEKLGEKANLLRKENYEQLRKDGNKVWHGPLSGQLLADVLENDFMEAM